MTKVIAHVIRQLKFGGGEVFVQRLVAELPQYQHIIVGFEDGPLAELLKSSGYEVYIIPLKGKNLIKPAVYGNLVKVLKEAKVDLVHAHGSQGGFIMALLSLWTSFNWIYTVHGWSFHPGISSLKFMLRVQLERWIVGKSQTTVCVSQSDSVHPAVKDLGKKFQVIRNGIPLTEALRVADIEPAQTQTILFFGRLTLQKDALTLLKAFQLIAPQFPAAKLLLVGGGEDLPQIEVFVKSHQLTKQVELRPYTSEIFGTYQQAGIYVLPSLWEGFSLALLEAMASARCVVVSDIPNNAEAIEDGISGFSFQTGNPDSLAKVLQKLLQEPELVLKTGKAARLKAISEYSFSALAEKYAHLYQKLLK